MAKQMDASAASAPSEPGGRPTAAGSAGGGEISDNLSIAYKKIAWEYWPIAVSPRLFVPDILRSASFPIAVMPVPL